MITLAAETGDVEVDADAGSLCVRHPAYAAPRTGPACSHLTWPDFVAAWRPHLAGRRRLVVVGLSRIVTPANRVRVGQLLLRPLDGVERTSVDRTLFVAEPWRAIWHFQCVGRRYLDFPHSFAAESAWRRAADDVGTRDPFGLETIAAQGRGVVTVRGAWFTRLDVRRLATTAEERAAYAGEKDAAFAEEHTSSAIIRRLARFAAKIRPERRVPTRATLFDARTHEVVQTDLGVDDWLVSELRSLVALTNGLAEVLP